MHIGLRIFLGFFLIVELAAFFTLRVFSQEIKPGVRQVMEDTMVDAAYVLAKLAAEPMADGQIMNSTFSRALGDLQSQTVNASIWGIAKQSLDYRIYITDTQGIVRFDSAGHAIGKDFSRWNDIYLTLRGEYGVRTTRSDPDDESSSIMYVAAPIRKDGHLLGVLTVAKSNQSIAPFIKRSEEKILYNGILLIGAALLIGLTFTGWLIYNLNQLRSYAKTVSSGQRASMPLQGGSQLAELGKAMENMRQRLEDKQYVEQYIHTLTHEMKSPLAAITGAAELLQEDMPAADRAHFIDNIQRQTQRLTLLIQKLLSLAELEQRQMLQNVEAVRLDSLLQELIAAHSPRARQRNIRLQFHSDPLHPTVWGDPFLLQQAFTNLLDNALDFSPFDSCIEITITQGSSQTYTITFCDAGPGIPDYALERLFDRFYSLNRPDSNEKSTGLGLCFVREITALHQGKIHIKNRPEGGTCALLELPAGKMKK